MILIFSGGMESLCDMIYRV